jgi:quercetin dioxygenase-like cupin family protein
MKRLAMLSVLLAWTMAVLTGEAGKDKPHGDDMGHVLLKPDDLKWGPAPPSLPAGAQAAVLSGDPTKAGPFTIRVKAPDAYKVPLHWHPTDEHVTVLKGTLLVSYEKGKDLATQPLPTGSFMRMPKEMKHSATAKGETILQIHGTGPFVIHYVDPKDDPRKKD